MLICNIAFIIVLTILATTTTLLLAKNHLCLHYIVKLNRSRKPSHSESCTMYKYIGGSRVLNVAEGGESMYFSPPTLKLTIK